MIHEAKPTQSTFKLPRKLSSKSKNRRKYVIFFILISHVSDLHTNDQFQPQRCIDFQKLLSLQPLNLQFRG